MAEEGPGKEQVESHRGVQIVDVHARLAAGPCSLVAATIEDGLAVPERPNLPGTTSERPNWSFGLPVSLEKALDHPLLGRVADALQR